MVAIVTSAETINGRLATILIFANQRLSAIFYQDDYDQKQILEDT
jgi:hypothetical protein